MALPHAPSTAVGPKLALVPRALIMCAMHWHGQFSSSPNRSSCSNSEQSRTVGASDHRECPELWACKIRSGHFWPTMGSGASSQFVFRCVPIPSASFRFSGDEHKGSRGLWWRNYLWGSADFVSQRPVSFAEVAVHFTEEEVRLRGK